VNQFYASFIPGLQNIIVQVIKERLADVIIHKLLDGAVLFETKTSYDKLNFFCFNNIFAMISIAEEFHTGSSNLRFGRHGENIFIKYINELLNDKIKNKVIANNSKKIKTFRIVISNENVPAAIDEKLRVEAEKFISRLSGLKVNRTLPDTEFWFLYRRDDSPKGQDFLIFMKRLTIRPSWEKTLHKGELPPPLTWILCYLASPVYSDTILDPFCGYGSIPDAAFKYFHIKNFITCDNNKEAAKYTGVKFKNRKNSGFILYNMDFCRLPSVIKEKSIDVIITDPPWGHYSDINTGAFLKEMFEIFGKLLKDGGKIILLYANDNSLVKAIPSFFELKSSIPVLLSGKKAVIFILEKTSHRGTEAQS